MRVLGKCLSVAGLALSAAAGPIAAEAQVRASTVKPAAIAATPGAGKWTCVSRASIEIAPVSYDTAGEPSRWVVVHRVQGEIVAAERVTSMQIDQLRRLPCGTPDSDLGGVALVG